MIELPRYPGPQDASLALMDFGGHLTPALGGPVQRVNRLGNRFRMTATMPPMPAADDGRKWLARLLRGKTEGVRIEVPLLGFEPGLPGAPVVDGAGQAGSTLSLRGFTPRYVAREGQFFSLTQGGRSYLYGAAAEALADASGEMTLPITPLLRAPTVDGAACQFARPMIEGFIEGEEWEWQMSLAHHLSLSFTVAERA